MTWFVGVFPDDASSSEELSTVPTVTGPSRPDSIRGVVFVSFVMLVRVSHFSGGRDWSPMMRLGQKLTTSISRRLPVGWIAPVTSTRKGGVQSTPRFLPLRRTSANSLTLPKSSVSGCLTSRSDGGRSNDVSYTAVPE